MSHLRYVADDFDCLPVADRQVFDSKGFQKESDIYSLSIILWEMATRIILGEYQKPFGEYKAFKLDFQILVASAKQGMFLD